jgi:Concanavalin A-like lectin/glucanases superfamily
VKKLLLLTLVAVGLIGSAGAQTQLTGSLTNGLVAYYPFNGNSYDYSGNGLNLTISGSENYNFGIDGRSCAYFNGIDTAYILDTPISQSNNFTWSLWFNLLSLSTIQGGDGAHITMLMNLGELNTGFNSPRIIIQKTDLNKIAFTAESYDWKLGSQSLYSICSLSTNSWHQIIWTSDNDGNRNLYLDGLIISSKKAQLYGQQDTRLCIGGTPLFNPGYNWYFNGYLSDVRIYNRPLSSDEVAALYTLESTSPVPILSQPLNVQLTATNSQSATFSIVATNGTPPYAYQWMKDGVDLTNQTNASLVLSNAGANTVGYYSCQVTDANSNSVISSNAALNISGVPFWLWQGMVGYWPLHEDLNDYSGNGNNLIKSKNNLYFVSEALKMQKDEYLHSIRTVGFSGNNNRTISFWVKINNNNFGQGVLISIGSGNIWGNDYTLCYNYGNQPNLELVFSAWSQGVNYENLTDDWKNITYVYKGNPDSIEFYINGLFYGIATPNSGQSSLNTSETQLFVNARTTETINIGADSGIDGYFKNIAVYNRALSSNEVASLYALESNPQGATNSQSITFPSIPSLTITNGVYSLGGTASSGLPVSYSIGDSTVAGITNGTLIPLGVGITTIVATQAGDGTNWMAATPVTNTLIVSLAQQSFTASPISGELYGSLPIGLNLPSNPSGIAVIPSVVSGPATLSGTNLILTGTGTVTVAYSAPGSSLYAPYSVTNSFTVTNGPTNLKTQILTFKPFAATTYGQKPLILSGSSSSKLPLSYWSSNTNVAVINGTNAIITGAGQTVITAYQPGDGATYNPANPVSQALLVNQSAQKLTLKAPKSLAYGSTPVAVSATSTSGLPVTLTSSDPTIVTITNNGTNSLLVPTGVGTVTLTASQPGNSNFVIAPSVGQFVVVTPGTQTITFPSIGTSTSSVTQITVPGNTQHPIVVGSSNTVVSVGGPNGNVTITSALVSSVTYAPGLSLALAATSSAGLPISYTSSATNLASVSGSTVTVSSAGSVKITASQNGNSLWAPAKAVTQTLNIAKSPQTISFSVPSIVTFTNGGPLPLTGSASSGLPVSYKSGNPKILYIQGTNCLISGRGTTTVVASQAGGSNYLPAPSVTNTVTVQ